VNAEANPQNSQPDLSQLLFHADLTRSSGNFEAQAFYIFASRTNVEIAKL